MADGIMQLETGATATHQERPTKPISHRERETEAHLCIDVLPCLWQARL
jgi:hypothetical protein